MKHVLTGQVCEVGNLIDAHDTTFPGIGIRIDGWPDGEQTIIFPVTWGEAQKLGASLFDTVSITIESVPRAPAPEQT